MYSVFLVEDEASVRQAIRDTIDWQSEGFVFCGDASDGESALPLLLKQKPDILVTDICMPFMDGLELVRIVNKELPKTIIIILSGHDAFTYAQKAITLGVSDYLLKPITPSKLIRSLTNAVKKIEDKQDELRKQLSLERSREGALPSYTESAQIGQGDVCIVDRDAICELLRFGNATDTKAFATNIAQKIFAESKGSLLNSHYFVFDVMTTAYKTARDMNLEIARIDSFEQITREIRTPEACAEKIHALFAQIINARYSMTDKTVQLINGAKSYIDLHFDDYDLSLSKVAANVGVSPNYLSNVFSRESGETFSEYLNKVRIKQAMLLLKSTELRAADIAEKVGYNDQHYFSKMFKKIIGISPREFKNM